MEDQLAKVQHEKALLEARITEILEFIDRLQSNKEKSEMEAILLGL
jgi:uncharacterized protein YkvS